jgi:hypothetical protein
MKGPASRAARPVGELVTERIEVQKPVTQSHRGKLGNVFDPERVKIKFAA